MSAFLSSLLGAVIGAFATFFACRHSAASQHHSDLINQLSHALSDCFAAFSAYQRDPDDPNFVLLVSTDERVRLFCSESLLPAVDAFRSKVLNRSTPQEELGHAFRAVSDLARDEIQGYRNRCNR